MLKRFLLNMLSSFVGAWIALALFIISAIFLVLGLVGSLSLNNSGSIEQVKSRSILMIDLQGVIEERESINEPDILSVLQGGLSAPQTLDVIIQAIREAATNDDIVAIYLKCGPVMASPATLNAIRLELQNFKTTTSHGKKIIAYADSYTQGAYFVASIADCIYMNPAGELALHGLGSYNMYFKELLEKLGVQFQVVKVGTYKSAVEPYILNEMSEPARAQLDTLYSNMWSYIRKAISDERSNVSIQKIDSLISRENISFAGAKETLKSGLIDSLIYERDIKKRLSEISGREVEKLNFVGPVTLAAQTPWASAYNSKNQIAVLFACGEIADGNKNEINYEDLVPVITKLAEDGNVKGMVLRVNSPGGSVFGSDQIGEALDYFKSKGKPLAVSMGDYAASGGYWISAMADRIFADPLTITGSIGIFGLIPNFKGTLDKVGIHVSSVSTNPGANFPNGFEPMDDVQLNVMQKYVDRGYEQFTQRVAKGRNLPIAKVKSIAEGRVWDAQTALKIGLVDALGGTQEAIDWVANQAKIASNYDVAAYPQLQPSIWNMIQLNSMSMTMGDFKNAVDSHNQDIINAYLINRIIARKPVQARMPEIKVIL